MRTIKVILAGLTILAILFTGRKVKAEEEKAENYRCKNIELQNIPIGNFVPPRQNPYNKEYEVSQDFNSLQEETGFNSQQWGHAGYDLQGLPKITEVYNGRTRTKPNQHAIFSILTGKVIVSAKESVTGGWGESVVIATRLNEFSEEILTHHYHHFHAGYNGGENGNEYFTTREVSACDLVDSNQKIGMEGTTGFSSGAHLHLGLRRWANITQLNDALKTGILTVFGPGYVYNNTSALSTNLNPAPFLNNTFLDYDLSLPTEDKPCPWYWQTFWFAYAMRSNGIELGLWNGNFGAEKVVKRREAARWIKIAAKQKSSNLNDNIFSDINAEDPDYPYIEALTRYPAIMPVIDKGNNGQLKAFEPDRDLCRSEALKMIITAFHLGEFLQYYEQNYWMRKAEDVLTTVLPYKDLHPMSWYASYAMFALERSIIDFGADLNACDPVNRAQFAFMLVRSAKYLDKYTQDNYGACGGTEFCDFNQYCNPKTSRCERIPTCIPSENNPCAIGGGLAQDEPEANSVTEETPGNNENSATNENPDTQQQPTPPHSERECSSKQIQQINCNTNGQLGVRRRGCINNETWGEWSACEIPENPEEIQLEGSCMNCGCTPGDTAEYFCWLNNKEGRKIFTCTPGGYWSIHASCQLGAESAEPNNNNGAAPNNDNQTNNNQTQDDNIAPDSPQTPADCECTTGPCCDGCYFSSNEYACKSWYTYRCPDNNNGSNAQKALVRQYCPGNINQCSGETKQFSWMTHEDCSTSQRCTMQGGESTCEGACTDTYEANTQSACYGNPYSSGSPTLCLNIKPQGTTGTSAQSGNWQYRVCKEGGAFQNSLKFRLKDDNNDVIFPNQSGNAGMTCTPWINFNIDYIDRYGKTNGAGLKAEVWSPANCNQSSCLYTTGPATISLACR